MNFGILGAGMMGRAIAFDLVNHSSFDTLTLADREDSILQDAQKFLGDNSIDYSHLDVSHEKEVTTFFDTHDLIISAIPYSFNYLLAQTAVQTETHFLDLGGNNDIVTRERSLHKQAQKKGVTIIPDCGLAPGLVSIITQDIVEHLDVVDTVKLRVGGLPVDPQPPLNYQIVFSPNGLINEYMEDSLILDHGHVKTKSSMTEVETLSFPKPFGTMEAFLTSGGCSTLPTTYKDTIGYLDYKTIRYPGHCEKFKLLLDLGMGQETPVSVGSQHMVPRHLLITLLEKTLPSDGRDVTLLKVIGEGRHHHKTVRREYMMIDYYDDRHAMTSMMRTTGFPVSIIAQLIEHGTIALSGVFCPEEIVPCQPFFKELEARGIHIEQKTTILQK